MNIVMISMKGEEDGERELRRWRRERGFKMYWSVLILGIDTTD